MTAEPPANSAPEANHPARDRLVWGTLLFVVIGVTGAFAIKSFQQSQREVQKTPPVISELPEFEFTERNGKPFGSRELKGHVFVADFIFVQCAGPCPAMSARMAQLAKAFENETDFRLVSFSVDPSHDTPQALREYAERFQAKEGRWFFLTGNEKAIHTLARQNFKMSVERGDKAQTDPGTAILHSTYFTLVDRRGRVRGYYNSGEPDANTRLLHDIPALLRENP